MGMNASIRCWHGFNYWSANKWIGVFWSYLKPKGLKLQDTHILWLIYITGKMKKILYYSCVLALNTKSLSGSVVEKIAVLFLHPVIKREVFIRISSWEYWLGVGTILDGVTHANLWKSCKMTMSLVLSLHWYVQTILTGQWWRRFSLIGATPPYIIMSNMILSSVTANDNF